MLSPIWHTSQLRQAAETVESATRSRMQRRNSSGLARRNPRHLAALRNGCAAPKMICDRPPALAPVTGAAAGDGYAGDCATEEWATRQPFCPLGKAKSGRQRAVTVTRRETAQPIRTSAFGIVPGATSFSEQPDNVAHGEDFDQHMALASASGIFQHERGLVGKQC